jgi:tetratricopeptide (TPR) repeat protein
VTQSLEKEIGSLRSLFWSERDPEGRAFAPLAEAYGRAGDFQRAMHILTEGIGRHPGFTTGHVVAGRLYLENGLISEAELAVRSALDLDGDNVVALESLARICEEQGDLEEAARVRAKVRSLELATEEPGDAEEDPVGRPVEVPLDITDLAPSEMPVVEPRPDTAPSLDEAHLDSTAAPAEEDSPGSWLDVAFPDEGEPVHDMLGLVTGEPVADILDFAPDEPVVDVRDLGSDEQPVTDTLDLTPDEPVLDILDLAPDVPVVDILALAPDEPVEHIVELAPDEPVMDVIDLRPDELSEERVGPKLDAPAVEDPSPGDELVDTEPVLTRTMAELYLEQGLAERALRVYRGLLADAPEDDELAVRVAELEGVLGVAARVEHEGSDEGAELSDPAWDARAQAAPHDVDTPFAWTDDEGEQGYTGPAIGTFFDQLLAWQPEHPPADDTRRGVKEEGSES